MSRILLACVLLVMLVAGCTPATETPGSSAVQETAVPPTAETANTIPAPQVSTADPTQTYVPVVQAGEQATLELTPTLSPTPTIAAGGPIDAISLEPVLVGGLNQPLYLTHAGDDRLFIVEQAGVIRIIQDGELLAEPFIDLTDRVGSLGNEQGLLSVVFHPQYSEEGAGGFGKFYVNYTDRGSNTQISRFSVDPANPNAADSSSEVILMSVTQPFVNHNGGLLKFGPDGYLYVGLGDGGSANDPLNSGQSLDTLLGSMLRIDVTDGGEAYTIPESNPFVGQSDSLGEIWAWGLRNPWRFSFDRQTGDLFIADVGQNIWEEVNFQPGESTGGENYGWNILEGTHCLREDNCITEGFVMPVAEYSHDVGGCSVTGGYVYRGEEFPEMLGNYFFGDYCTGIIWRLYPDGDNWEPVIVLDSDLTITSFGEDVNGEIYALDRRSGGVFRLVQGN